MFYMTDQACLFKMIIIIDFHVHSWPISKLLICSCLQSNLTLIIDDLETSMVYFPLILRMIGQTILFHACRFFSNFQASTVLFGCWSDLHFACWCSEDNIFCLRAIFIRFNKALFLYDIFYHINSSNSSKPLILCEMVFCFSFVITNLDLPMYLFESKNRKTDILHVWEPCPSCICIVYATH